jgi:hypothetical protein
MFGSSILVKLTKGGHRHNGVLCNVGDKIRVPDDVAVAMRGRGECDYVTGKELATEYEKAKVAQAKLIDKHPQNKGDKGNKGK